MPNTQNPDAQAQIAAFYARGLVDYLRGRGVDAASLLPEAPMARPEAMAIAPEVSLTEWATLLDAAATALDEPELPARAGASLQVRHLGPLGHVLMGCANLKDAYLQLARFIRLLGQIGKPELTVQGETAHLLWQWPYPTPAPQSVAMFMLGARTRFMRWLSDKPDLVVDVYFHGPAPYRIEGFTEVFGGRVEFDAPHSEMIFPARYLGLPVVTADEEFRQQAEERAQAQLQRLTGDSPLLRQVKGVLLLNLASGRVHLNDTAQNMNVTPRTLQRRLADLDTHYQEVLDQVRAETAEQLLRDPEIPLAQVAFLLGYSDQSTFQTAFRRWTGLSPGAYQRKRSREKR
jgi:AraC-like DNA-binding protein